MRAKQTSPPAAVQRFKGGQYNVDGDEGLIKNLFERRKVEDTDYSEGVKPTAPVARGSHDANVHTAPNNPTPKGGPVAKMRDKASAHVGGGHERRHQG